MEPWDGVIWSWHGGVLVNEVEGASSWIGGSMDVNSWDGGESIMDVMSWSWWGRGPWDGLRGINEFWGIRKLWDGELLRYRGEDEYIMACLGTIYWHGIGCLHDWITSFLVWYLDKLSTNDCGTKTNLLQGGDDVDFEGLGLCGDWALGRGLGWWFWILSSKYGELHGGFVLDRTWGLWTWEHGGRGYMIWQVDFFFWLARLKIEFLSSLISLAMTFMFEELVSYD